MGGEVRSSNTSETKSAYDTHFTVAILDFPHEKSHNETNFCRIKRVTM